MFLVLFLRATWLFFSGDITKISGNLTQVSGDMTSGEMTLGRIDCKPVSHDPLVKLCRLSRQYVVNE